MRLLKRLPYDVVYSDMESPVGVLRIIANNDALFGVLWDCDPLTELTRDERNSIIQNTKQQLQEYFHGKRKAFDLPLAAIGTAFQTQAWKALQEIPYGKTISYGKQAERIGDKKKARAVGVANGENPISIIIPCHRVIGANGSLVGFGGGLDRKRLLLDLEQEYL